MTASLKPDYTEIARLEHQLGLDAPAPVALVVVPAPELETVRRVRRALGCWRAGNSEPGLRRKDLPALLDQACRVVLDGEL